MLATAPLPWIVRTAVADRPPVLPGYATLTSRITLGLPHVMVLDQRLTLGLVAPTGIASFWLATPREAVVSQAGEDRPGAPPFRLTLRADGARMIGVAPVVLGPARFVGSAGTEAPGLRLRVTGWMIHAGSLVGAGDFGSYITFDWKPWGTAAGRFEAPIARPAVLRRLALDASGMGTATEAELAAVVETTAAPGPGAGRFAGHGRSFADD